MECHLANVYLSSRDSTISNEFHWLWEIMCLVQKS